MNSIEESIQQQIKGERSDLERKVRKGGAAVGPETESR